jgi:spore maturation protein CgeB
MAGAFASAKLCLGFLRKANRDLHTARTFEIPACGGVMLTERTDEQRAFFEEGNEALYFDSAEEMVAKIRDYTARPDELARIRAAALERCRRSRYSYAERMQDLLARILPQQV